MPETARNTPTDSFAAQNRTATEHAAVPQEDEEVPLMVPVPRLALLGVLAAVTGVAVARLTHGHGHVNADWLRQLRWWLIVWPTIVITLLVLFNQSTQIPRRWVARRYWADQERIVVGIGFCLAGVIATRIWG